VSEEGVERRLTTILAADVVGYSRLMAADEAGTLASLKAIRRELVEPKTTEHHGRVVKLIGDGTLMEFASVVDAVLFAVDVQQAMAARNARVPEDRRITYRIGINIGDIIVEGDDIYGDGVNVAARLEALAEPGGVCVSRTVFDHVKGKVEVGFEDLGAQTVKNIPEPVQTFKVLLESPTTEHVIVATPAAKRTDRWPVVAGSLIVLVILSAALVWLRPWEERLEPASVERMAFPLPDKPSIAVLPFNNMSDDPSQEYFADGMTEDLITDLSKISGLFVIARNSSFSYKGQAVQVRQVAEELGVRYVLEGSVRRVGDQVRINAQLIDATTGGHIWAERYDGTLDDVFALQDNVTREIIAALAVTLTGEEVAQQARHETTSAAAHDAYLQGWAHYRLLTPEELTKAVPFFEEAIRLDPGYAQAHAALASAYWDVFKNDWAFDLGLASFQAEERANAHLETALKSPTPLAHALQARIMASAGFYDLAVTEAASAVALDGNDAAAHAGLAEALIFADRPGEALGPIQTAMRLDPHHPPSYLITLGAVQFGGEQFDEAVATFERAVKRNPDNEIPLIYLASSYGHLGRMTEAEAAIEAANDVRARHGMGALSLESVDRYDGSPFKGEIDFNRFGGETAQKRLRAGLSEIPALSWQYLVTGRQQKHSDGTYSFLYEIEGATEVDLATAKAFYDRGAVFVDVSDVEIWRQGHIPNSIHLPKNWNPNDLTGRRLTEMTLREIVDKTDEIVFLGYFEDLFATPASATAKAINWGYEKVYYFVGGAPAWKAAGYPIETGE
jgi:TolB-like protein/class 3 adenylate cyclase/rhodanese-related sulfurtransferase